MSMIPNVRIAFLAVLLLLLGAPLPVGAASPAPAVAADTLKALSIAEFERWRTVRSVAISDDGRWVSFAYELRKTDDTLFVRNLDDGTAHALPRGSRPQFSDDSRWIAYNVLLPVPEIEKLERERKPVPVRAELLDLRTGEVVGGWENVASFAFSKGSATLAVRKTKLDPRAEHDGADLFLRDLRTGTEELIGWVASFEFNKPGNHLAYTLSAPDREGNGLYLLDLASMARRPLDGERQDYARLAWDEEGTAVAVLRGVEPEGFEQRQNALVAVTGIGSRRGATVRIFDPAEAEGFPPDTVISERASLSWSEDLSRVVVGLIGQREKSKRENDKEARADVDIWHWRDDRLQSVQMNRANQDRNRTHAVAVDLAGGRLIRLADEEMATVQLSRDGNWGIGRDERAYVHDWRPQLADYYRVDARTGERRLILEAHQRGLGFSPDSRHYLYWKDGHVWSYELAADRHLNLTENSPVSFVNEEFDRLGEKPPYGVAGYTSDNRSVILQHRFDLWLQPLDGRPASNLTLGRGAADSTRFRYVRLDPEERSIDLSKPLLLSAFGEWSKDNGFFRLHRGRLTELVYRDTDFGSPAKAKNADRLLFTIQRFDVFPDYHVSDGDFSEIRQITEANPQQAEYRWGKRILFDFQNRDGERLQGTLAIPDDYQPGQRLPMLVNFYEKNSQNLHRYPAPRYASSPQFAGFVSNGYLVMQPDIHFRGGTSHLDMLECVEAAVQKVIDMGYADPARVGLHGHSYSGQGAAFIATQSRSFAAILAGAAATNLISDFNQLWKSAGTNQHRYNILGQGRFGTSPYEDLELYRSQSAVYHATSMDTPLLLLHGTDDGSVEWLQAVEFYNALRYNEKPVIMLSYPGEAHGLRKFENQKDFLERMQDFFDHHLKDMSPPPWLEHGVPFLEKNRQPARPAADTGSGPGGR